MRLVARRGRLQLFHLGREAPEKPGPAAAVLLEGFSRLKFEYLMNDGVDSEWKPAWDGHEEEMLPAAVRIVVEGLPGFGMDSWGQEIPIMATAYGENTGEVDEEDLSEVPVPGAPNQNQNQDQTEDQNDDDTGGGPE